MARNRQPNSTQTQKSQGAAQPPKPKPVDKAETKPESKPVDIHSITGSGYFTKKVTGKIKHLFTFKYFRATGLATAMVQWQDAQLLDWINEGAKRKAYEDAHKAADAKFEAEHILPDGFADHVVSMAKAGLGLDVAAQIWNSTIADQAKQPHVKVVDGIASIITT